MRFEVPQMAVSIWCINRGLGGQARNNLREGKVRGCAGTCQRCHQCRSADEDENNNYGGASRALGSIDEHVDDAHLGDAFDQDRCRNQQGNHASGASPMPLKKCAVESIDSVMERMRIASINMAINSETTVTGRISASNGMTPVRFKIAETIISNSGIRGRTA